MGREIEDRIIRLRKELAKLELEAGAETIRVHRQRDPTPGRVPAVSTLWRILVRRGFVTPNHASSPQRRPHPGSRLAADHLASVGLT